MRILCVIDSLGSGGAQRQMVSLAQGMVARSHEVEFFIYHPELDHFKPILVEHGIPVNHWSPRSRVKLGLIVALRQHIAKGAYDIVLSFLDAPNLYSELARLGKRTPALVVSERNTYPPAGPSLGKRLLEQGYRLADHVTVNSHFQASRMVESAPWLRTRISTIYNGLDLQQFRPTATKKLPGTLLAVGSVIPVKNALGLAQALGTYRESYGEAPVIHWAGSVYSTERSQTEFKRVDSFLRAHDLLDNWVWLGEQKDMPAVYARYIGLIHPSFLEGLPNAVCEAMACGLPVLASDVCEHPRLVLTGETGFRFDPNQSFDICESMHQLLSLSDAERTAMSRKCRTLAETEFDVRVYLNRYEGLFTTLIKT